MTNPQSENNKRIVKNTGALYIRMLFTMVVGLYTSRIILNVLGIEDYGIYNVVGGVVYMFFFITNAMTTATSRYLTFEIGSRNLEQLKRVFSTSLTIHVIIAMLIFLLGETFGLWFLKHKMQIPESRMDAAIWVLHSTIIYTVFDILIVPFGAAITSHEKMTAFAYISIVDVILKLFFVYLLWVIPYDKLKVHATLFVISRFMISVIYVVYSRIKFEEVRLRYIWDKILFKEMLSFSGWSLIGNLGGVTTAQGLNIILNVFFGPAVNAARGVAVQVQGIVGRFSNNFQTALNPQITKSYAAKDLKHMHTLLFASSKFSFYLLFLLSLPVLFETNLILTWWLKIVPDHTINFLRIIIFSTILEALANPLSISVQAHGTIRRYETAIGILLILQLPISYIALKLDTNPESVFIIQLFIIFITHIVRLYILKPLIELSLLEYTKEVALKILLVTLSSIIIPLFIHLSVDENVSRFFITCISSTVGVLLSVYFLGLHDQEKRYVLDVLQQYNSKYIKKTKRDL